MDCLSLSFKNFKRNMTVEIFLTGAHNFELLPKENYLGNCIKIEFEGVDIDLQKAMQGQKIYWDYQMKRPTNHFLLAQLDGITL